MQRLLALALLAVCLVPAPARAQNPFLSERGQRTVSEVVFVGHEITKEYVLRREAGVQVGDDYSSTLLPEVRERLDALPFVSYVDIQARPDGPGKMALEIKVIEDSRFRWSTGIRYERRYDGWIGDVTLGMINLTGRAETLALRMFAWNQRGAELRWSNPHILGPAAIGVGVSAWLERYDWEYDPFLYTEWGFRGSAWHDFGPWVRVKGAVRWKEIEVDDVDADFATGAGGFGAFVEQETGIRLSAVHDSRDQRHYPSRGLYLSASYQWGDFGGKDFGITELESRVFYPVAYLGILSGFSSIRLADSSLPFYERTYLGGPMSLRGVDFGRDRGDEAFRATLELRRPVFVLPLRDGKAIGLGVHAFHDWGKVWEDGQSFSDRAPGWDYGAGAHFNFGTRNYRFEWARTDEGEDFFVFEDRFTF